jgi:hypothetical protein
MGYLTPYGYSKKQIIEEVTKGAIDFSVKGNTVYVLHTAANSGKKFIAVVLIKKSGGNYGYKVIPENQHPYYYDCPEKILKQSEVNDPHAIHWRDKCREVKQNLVKTKEHINNMVLGKEKFFSYNGRKVEYLYTYSPKTIVGKDVECGTVYRYSSNRVMPL